MRTPKKCVEIDTQDVLIDNEQFRVELTYPVVAGGGSATRRLDTNHVNVWHGTAPLLKHHFDPQGVLENKSITFEAVKQLLGAYVQNLRSIAGTSIPMSSGYTYIIQRDDGTKGEISDAWPEWGEKVVLRANEASGNARPYPIVIETRVDPNANILITSEEPTDQNERQYVLADVRRMLGRLTENPR